MELTNKRVIYKVYNSDLLNLFGGMEISYQDLCINFFSGYLEDINGITVANFDYSKFNNTYTLNISNIVSENELMIRDNVNSVLSLLKIEFPEIRFE